MTNLGALWPILKRLLSYALPWRKSLQKAMAMLWIAAVAEVLGPVLIGYFIDHVVAQRNISPGLISTLIVVFVACSVIAAWLHYHQSLLFNQAAIGVVQSLRSEVMDAALNQPLWVFDTQPVGQIISRVTNDTEVIKDLYVTVVSAVLHSVVLICAMLVAMFLLDWRMALVAMILFPLVLFVMVIYQRYSTPVMRRVRHYLADINDGFNEVISGMAVIQLFRQQTRFSKRMHEVSMDHYRARMQSLRLEGFLLRPLLSLFSALILCGLMALFGFSPAGTFDVGILYVFISYLGRLNEPLIELTTQQTMLQQAVVAGERVFALMDAPPQQYGEDHEVLSTGGISLRSLCFSYNKNYPVLTGIDLEVASCQFVAIVGHTGSGKSTLAGLLMGYYAPTRGQILIDNRPLSTLSHDVLRQGIAMVQQDPVVLADTLYTNVALGRAISEDKVWQALEIVQLMPLVQSLEKGIHTRMDEQGNNLSVGQKQLLALARVLVATPKILILDEATANIDSQTERAIQKALFLIRQSTTLIVIAHRLSTITEADTILVLHRGEIIERGRHHQLLTQHGRYWQMYQLQQVGNAVNGGIADRM